MGCTRRMMGLTKIEQPQAHCKARHTHTHTRNQGRGVKNHQEGGPIPFKSSRETLFAIELVIEPSELLERPIGGQTIFRHRQKHFYASAISSFSGTQDFD